MPGSQGRERWPYPELGQEAMEVCVFEAPLRIWMMRVTGCAGLKARDSLPFSRYLHEPLGHFLSFPRKRSKVFIGQGVISLVFLSLANQVKQMFMVQKASYCFPKCWAMETPTCRSGPGDLTGH